GRAAGIAAEDRECRTARARGDAARARERHPGLRHHAHRRRGTHQAARRPHYLRDRPARAHRSRPAHLRRARHGDDPGRPRPLEERADRLIPARSINKGWRTQSATPCRFRHRSFAYYTTMPTLVHEYRGPAWWPLRRIADAGNTGGARHVVGIWFLLSCTAVLLAVIEAQQNWSGIPVSIGGISVPVTIYPPLAITLLLVVW